ncbi:MAG: RnfH family protein [Gammaproteobacteria bacterium]|nr:RnfH family protein [Gammaproteobacteria bacterium]
MADEKMRVEVAYALADEQLILEVQAEPGLTLEAAVEKSGILQRFPQIDWATADVGLFGKLAKRTDLLQEGDRVEIYRPLIADPKEMRKKRAAEGKVMRRGGGEAAESDKST